MQRENFIDKETGEKFFIPTYRTSYKNDLAIYKDKYGKELINPENGNKLVPIPVEGKFKVPMNAKYNSSESGRANTNAYFKKRAENFNKKGDGKAIKNSKENAFKKNLMEQIKNGKKF